MDRGLGASPTHPPLISALQSSLKSKATQLAVLDCDFVHWDHSALSNDLTFSDYCVLKFEIWSWWCPLSTILNNSNLVCWRWKSFLINSLWRHQLQRCHIRSRLIWVSKECTFHWYIDCEKYRCPICRGRELLGWPSYSALSTMVRPTVYYNVRWKIDESWGLWSRINVSGVRMNLVPNLWTADGEGALPELGPCPHNNSCISYRWTEWLASRFFIVKLCDAEQVEQTTLAGFSGLVITGWV